MSLREDILVRINEAVDGITGSIGSLKVGRNQDDLSGRSAPAGILHDGDESLREDNNTPRSMRGSGPGILLDFMYMTPRLELVLSGSTETVGTKLNEYRDKVIVAIVRDATLASLVGQNGEIRYLGMTTQTQAGEKREGRAVMNFAFLYILDIGSL